ncbi:MAG: hypothetical protein GY719_06865 [bacterium]|nr:hypothetical protein [bacterium]
MVAKALGRGLWLAAASVLSVSLLVGAPARAQDEEFVPEQEETTEEAADFSAIDDMLALDEEVLSDPSTYSYDPGARRDPFRSLFRTRAPDRRSEKRPDGPAGLLIDELGVEGVFVLDDGPVVQVQSASQETSFLLRVGDQLWDGDVVRISLDEVVFKQSVDDPTALKPFREVVKKLR